MKKTFKKIWHIIKVSVEIILSVMFLVVLSPVIIIASLFNGESIKDGFDNIRFFILSAFEKNEES